MRHLWLGALTQGIKGGQDIKLHLLLELGGAEHEAESTGVLPSWTLDLKRHFKLLFSLTGFQLSPNFLDEFSSAPKLILKTCELGEEDDEVSI